MRGLNIKLRTDSTVVEGILNTDFQRNLKNIGDKKSELRFFLNLCQRSTLVTLGHTPPWEYACIFVD